jgi:hypothetical protein
MRHGTWIELVVVFGLLSSVASLVPASGSPAGAAQARAASVLYVKPGGTGDCGSWENACELQAALLLAKAGDEVWVAGGVYKPTDGINYATCQEIRAAFPAAPDGDYLMNSGGHVFQVYCADMGSTPVEYLSLWSASSNYARYTEGGASDGTNVLTTYSRVRLRPDTLKIDISDVRYSSSTGSLDHAGVSVTSMYYGVAMDCIAPRLGYWGCPH